VSAAEKLKALEAGLTEYGWEIGIENMEVYFSDGDPPIALLRDALPQIVAVVEAAEPYIKNAAPHEQLFSGEDLRNFQRLDAALSALDEALETK
jgi:hypothetical protein